MRVAVVGAGPSGASAARELAKAGATVTIFEKSAWPRAKACGDGLTPSSLDELNARGIALDPWAAFAKTIVSGPDEQTFDARWPALHANGTTMPRRTFDALLVDSAVAAGARFEPDTAATAARDGAIEVRTKAGSHSVPCDAIVLAEGATGGLASACGLPPHTERLPAYRGYCTAREPLETAYQVHYAAGVLPGYMWIFPSGDRTTANVGAMLVEKADVRAHVRDWMDSSAIARRWFDRGVELHDAAGGVIPIGRAQRVAANVFAVGDAAGVADPLTGEGISQAMISGRMAAEALTRAGGDVARAAVSYVRAVTAFDRNNREAMRMRAFVQRYARPFFVLAAKRPAFGDEIIASGYFQKQNAAWFWRASLALAIPRGRR
jgi:geranylgeranyl reductase family protein